MKQFFSLSLIGFSSLALMACTATNPQTLNIQTITPEQAAMCTFKGKVYSEAPYYGVFTGTTQEKLIDLGKESTIRLGATHLLPVLPVQKGNKMVMEGKAYVCP